MSDKHLPESEIILYETEDGRTPIQCRFEDETLWLTQAQMAKLFETTPQNVTLHLKSNSAKVCWSNWQLVRTTYKFTWRVGARSRASLATICLKRFLPSASACAAIEALGFASGPSGGSGSWDMQSATAPRSHPRIPPQKFEAFGEGKLEGLLREASCS